MLGVELDRTDAHGREVDVRRVAIDPAQQRVDTRDQLAHAERLRHVVVGADGEADQKVCFAVASGQHEDGHRAVVLDALAHLDAVEAGQHEIEHDEVGAGAFAELDTAGTVGRHLDVVSLAAQPGGDGLGDRRLVLDHHDGARGAFSRAGCQGRHTLEPTEGTCTSPHRPVEKSWRWETTAQRPEGSGAWSRPVEMGDDSAATGGERSVESTRGDGRRSR